jgi:hypothetical protein
MRSDAGRAARYQATARGGAHSREAFDGLRRQEQQLRSTAALRAELVQAVGPLVEHLCPRSTEAPATLPDALAAPTGRAPALSPTRTAAEPVASER